MWNVQFLEQGKTPEAGPPLRNEIWEEEEANPFSILLLTPTLHSPSHSNFFFFFFFFSF
jgi:hypothetical protein